MSCVSMFVCNVVMDATGAVPPLARQRHAYLHFISIHGFMLHYTLYDELCSHSISAPKISCIARNVKKA